MKLYVSLFVVLSFNMLSFSQRGGGGMQGGMRSGRQGGNMQNGMQQRPEARKFNAYNIAGFITYDSDEIIKKIKLKKDKKAVLGLKRAVATYNQNISEIKLNNKDNFDTLNIYMNSIMEAKILERRSGINSQRAGENEQMLEVRKKIGEKIKPARQALRKEDEKLNTALETLLDAKKYSKWLKYQKEIKDALKPEKGNRNQDNSSFQRSGGINQQRGGGMNRQRF